MLKDLIARREAKIHEVEQAFEAELKEFFSGFKDKMVEIALSDETKETTMFKGYSYFGQAGIIVVHGENQDGKFQPVPVMQVTMKGVYINSIKTV